MLEAVMEVYMEADRDGIHVSVGEKQSQNECDHSAPCDGGGIGGVAENPL